MSSEKKDEFVIDDGKPKPKVIGAGFGRTGTFSLRAGLNALGYKTHHMHEIFAKSSPEHAQIWTMLYKEKLKLKKELNITSFNDWDKIQLPNDKYGKYFGEVLENGGYTASVDWPSIMFYQEIMEYYKQKNIDFMVLLSVRDSGEKWWASYEATILEMVDVVNHWIWSKVLYSSKKTHLRVLENIFNLPFDGQLKYNKKHVINKYNEWIESVKKFVDKEKLIIYNVKTGWKPLTEPLGLEIPEKYADKPDEFIRTNESKEYKEKVRKMRRMTHIADFIAGSTIISIIAGGYYAYKKYYNA